MHVLVSFHLPILVFIFRRITVSLDMQSGLSTKLQGPVFSKVFKIGDRSFKGPGPGSVLVCKWNLLNIYNKFTGKHPWQCVISIKLQSNCIFSEHLFLKTPLDCYFWNCVKFFRILFLQNFFGRLLVIIFRY